MIHAPATNFDKFWYIVPALTCNASMSANGVVMVTLSYVHTGGLPLTNLSLSYTYEDMFIISKPVLVSISSVDTTRITIPDLEAGFRYTFIVTSQNRIGSTNTVCGLLIPMPGNSKSDLCDRYYCINNSLSLSSSCCLIS